ncbi:MAG: putative 4-hydroxybenzoate polyprenyltransferase [Dehalococcoidales bacterium]|nr:putative 4-hydroxybenzoate polyprenyltransferase [Dehalococcoidales bacterium]
MMLEQRSPGARYLGKLGTMLEAIKFEHTIFTLPFAYLGMVLAARGLPTLQQVVWITVALAAARTWAMGTNRLIDREMDALNPRTARRALPIGLLTPRDMWLLSSASVVILLVAAWQLNDLCLKLAPLAIAFLFAYSYVKRYSWATHIALGISDGLAPLGAWIGVTGSVSLEAILLFLAVGIWIGGFDLIYACQDVEFDRTHTVESIAKSYGVAAALNLSSLAHALTALILLALGLLMGLGPLYYVGWLLAVGLLIYEHRLVSPTDLSRLNVAFFNVNGYIAVIVFAFTFASIFV